MRRLAGVLLVLASMEIALGLGVRIWFSLMGVALSDFREVGATVPMSPGALRAAPFTGFAVSSTNLLTVGSLVLIPFGVIILGFGLVFRERRGVLLAMLAMALLIGSVWLGFQQGERMLGAET